MGLSQVNLQNYDMVVAVTQNAVNEGLAEYLNSQQTDVALYYTVDNNGNYVPSTEADAYYVFTGTLDYTRDANQNPVDIITLNSQGKGVQTVYYNITFSNANFYSTIIPKFNTSQGTGNPWIISFLVNLAAQEVAVSSLSSAMQTQVQSSTGSLGANMFSVQQLYLDLNTAVFDTFQNITGLSTYAEGILTSIMTTYLASLQASGGVIFGYSLVATPANATPPTFMPTALDFCVTPYTDPADGQQDSPGLDTLNYLLMINNNALPATPPTSFGFNWVDAVAAGASAESGAIALRHDHYLTFLDNQLSPILPPLCLVCYTDASNDNSLNDQTMALNANTSLPSPAAFQILTGANPSLPGLPGLVGTFSYASPQSYTTDSGFGGSTSVTLNYNMGCTVALNTATTNSVTTSTVELAGYACISAETSSSDEYGNVTSVTMPPTTYPWSVDLVLQMSLSTTGQLMYAIQNGNYTTAPTVASQNESAWDTFLNAVAGNFQTFSTNLGNLAGTVETNISGINTTLTTAINTVNDFVFPGGSTFLFDNPQVSNANDLVCNITYQGTTA